MGVIEKARIGLKYYDEEGELEERNSLVVPFNPSMLRYFASGEKIIQSSYRQMKLKDMRFQQEAKAITGQLSFQLIFDEVELISAFMEESMKLVNPTPTPTAVIKGAVGAIKSGVQGPPSVKDVMCAFTGALLSEVDAVSFQWNDMEFVGTVTEIQMMFTMFSIEGEPIRGTVDMRLTEHVNETQKRNQNKAAFDGLFKDNVADATNAAQKVGNLLNLNL